MVDLYCQCLRGLGWRDRVVCMMEICEDGAPGYRRVLYVAQELMIKP
jgi:hypothetical protein